MLRGIASTPVCPESYARAEIVAGRVGLEQEPTGGSSTAMPAHGSPAMNQIVYDAELACAVPVGLKR